MEALKAWLRETVNLRATHQQPEPSEMRTLVNRICSHALGSDTPFVGFSSEERDKLVQCVITYFDHLRLSAPSAGRKTLKLKPEELGSIREDQALEQPEALQRFIQALERLDEDKVIPAFSFETSLPERIYVEIIQRDDTTCLGVRWGPETLHTKAEARAARVTWEHPYIRMVDYPVSIDVSSTLLESGLTLFVVSYEAEKTQILCLPAESWVELKDLGRSLVYPSRHCRCVALLPPY